MSRPRHITNEAIYEAAHEPIIQHGPDSLTFQTLSRATGRVPAALVLCSRGSYKLPSKNP